MFYFVCFVCGFDGFGLYVYVFGMVCVGLFDVMVCVVELVCSYVVVGFY